MYGARGYLEELLQIQTQRRLCTTASGYRVFLYLHPFYVTCPKTLRMASALQFYPNEVQSVQLVQIYGVLL